MARALIFLFALRAAVALQLPEIAALANVAVDAIPVQFAPSPRYNAIRKLLGRQEAASCNVGFHNCADVERLLDCCADDRVCFINTNTKKSACCPIGSTCEQANKACDINKQYECNRTTATVENGVSTTYTEANCCDRRCPNGGGQTKFMCPSASWTKSDSPFCCAVGNICGTSGSCLVTSSSSSSSTPQATPTGGGAGGGNASPTPTGPSEPSMVPHDPGLSTGAKAGIGAGVAIGASLLIGLATYFCVRQRRRAASSRGRGSVVTYTYGGERSGPHSGPGGLGLNLGSGFSSRGRADTYPHSTVPGSVGVGSGAMSETTDGEGRLRGIAQDYFGPDATVGPLTDVDGTGVRGSAGTSPGLDGGVPSVPLHPGHIVAPVEIDSKETPIRENPANGRPQDGSRRVSYYGNTGVHESIDGRFELYSESPPAWEGSPALQQGEQTQGLGQQGRDSTDEAGTMQTEGTPFLPREAAASPRSLSPRDMASPRSVSPVDPPSGHSNVPPGQPQGGSGGQHGTS